MKRHIPRVLNVFVPPFLCRHLSVELCNSFVIVYQFWIISQTVSLPNLPASSLSCC